MHSTGKIEHDDPLSNILVPDGSSVTQLLQHPLHRQYSIPLTPTNSGSVGIAILRGQKQTNLEIEHQRLQVRPVHTHHIVHFEAFIHPYYVAALCTREF